MAYSATLASFFTNNCTTPLSLPGGGGILVPLDLIRHPLLPHIHRLLANCRCRVSLNHTIIMVDSLPARDYPLVSHRVRFSPFRLDYSELYDGELYFLIFTHGDDDDLMLADL